VTNKTDDAIIDRVVEKAHREWSKADLTAIRDNLIAARDLIADPQHWCRDYFALDDKGRMCDAIEDKARQWCATGAYIWASEEYGDDGRDGVWDGDGFLGAAARLAYHGSIGIADVNDHLGHAAVMRVYDLAIATVERLIGERGGTA